ncbi:PREDICTED: uncharacterized protein LOC109156264 [Ipomoea nil]|uniref:uncharacterized protein LOC109156264 n=1 Tax=Ipomoea nil TaxID=35883 RepID=UPI00090145FB|nr:PREDICTED: uncharacterized protein LOC109156264 [Ipomoea nil]
MKALEPSPRSFQRQKQYAQRTSTFCVESPAKEGPTRDQHYYRIRNISSVFHYTFKVKTGASDSHSTLNPSYTRSDLTLRNTQARSDLTLRFPPSAALTARHAVRLSTSPPPVASDPLASLCRQLRRPTPPRSTANSSCLRRLAACRLAASPLAANHHSIVDDWLGLMVNPPKARDIAYDLFVRERYRCYQ